MRLRALLRRLVLPPVAVGLAVSGLALPAQAADSILPGFALVLLDITDTVTVIDGQSKTVKFEVYNLGGAAAENVTIGFADGPDAVPSDIGFVPPAGCTATACKIAKLAGGERRAYTLTVKPDVASTTNLNSYFDLTATVGTEEHDKMQVQVVRTTKSAVDLEVGDLKDLKLGRGQSADLALSVRNTGNVQSGPLGLIVSTLGAGVSPDLNYRNCEKDADVEGLICVLDEKLAPGQAATLSASTPAKIKVAADAAGPADYLAVAGVVGLTQNYVDAFKKRTASKPGAELKLQPAATVADITDDDVADDLNPADNLALFYVKVPKSAADSKAIGGTFRGTPGDLVTVKVGTQNLGPTATIPISTKWIGYVHVNVPTNVKLTKADEWCVPGTSPTKLDLKSDLDSRDWVCLVFDQVAKGGKRVFAFEAMIQEGSHEAGFVQVDGGVQDTKHGNDKAALTVSAGSTGGEGGGLPITGPSAGLIAGGGAALLAFGVLAFRMARRRRIITVVE
ncbi:COG1361 family protein [Actinoplanes awajinensis]|uniref:hypothetical protein n=1 Tax=Actinoplanes awajinensis TaxID=135946 RepID=UPI0012FB0DDD|nr:hypothetical protein [Actinoplanes awajinensis]